MTTKKFKPKGKDVLKKEISEHVNKKYSHLDEDDRDKLIGDMLETRLKDENFKASVHKQKDNHSRGRKHYKTTLKEAGLDPKTGKPISKGNNKPKGDKEEQDIISADNKMYFFSRVKGTRTELRHLRKVMKATGKSFDKAMDDNLYTTWKQENDKLIKSKGSKLGASRGGHHGSRKTEEDKIEDDMSDNLPPSFSAKKKNDK